MAPLLRALPLLALAACASGGGSPSGSASAPGDGGPVAPPNIPAVNAPWRPLAGLWYQDIVEGTGAVVEAGKCVYVHYTGWLTDGTRFETSRDTLAGFPARPLAFPQGAGTTIAGWDRGVLGMRLFGKRRLWIPARFAYGERGSPPSIPPRATLIFDLEVMALAEPSAKKTAKDPPKCPAW